MNNWAILLIITVFFVGFICGGIAMCLYYAIRESKARGRLIVEEYRDLKRRLEEVKK